MKSNQTRRRPPPWEAAAELIAHGFAICRIEPGEKQPLYPDWATFSVAPDDIGPDHGVGIICGPLSGVSGHALVCVDLDDPEAVRLADEYLPPTGMVEGRTGKPRSHRWYSVPLSSIGVEYHSHAPKSAPVMFRVFGHPGPATKSFRGADKGELLKFIGTGGQANVPPSVHSTGEERVWDHGRAGKPAVVKFRKLLRAVKKLARECGWTPRAEPAETPTRVVSADAADTSVDPFLAFRINRYLDELPASVSGEGGHGDCYRAACALVWGFALGEADAMRFLGRFNRRCRPAWSRGELLHKVRSAAVATDHRRPRGCLLGHTSGEGRA